MSDESMRVTIPLTILALVSTIVVGIVGWVINDKLTYISTNINKLQAEISSLADKRYDHETRLRLLEEKASKNHNK